MFLLFLLLLKKNLGHGIFFVQSHVLKKFTFVKYFKYYSCSWSGILRLDGSISGRRRSGGAGSLCGGAGGPGEPASPSPSADRLSVTFAIDDMDESVRKMEETLDPTRSSEEIRKFEADVKKGDLLGKDMETFPGFHEKKNSEKSLNKSLQKLA